ncbi:glycoside hydrolase family 88 protein [soil metagenome]
MIEVGQRPSTEHLREAFDVAQQKVMSLVGCDPGFYPMFTERGKWRHGKPAWTHWCDGFLPGMMWIFASRTGDIQWRTLAETYSRELESRKLDRNVHDLGFLFWSTWKRWFDLEGAAEIEAVVITAGETMGHRFNERGRFLRSFVAPESTFIDIMMNVGIIFYAAERTANDDLRQRVSDHCLTTRRYLVRGDGSTAHEGIFDLDSGEFLRQSTHQGWRSDSSWARGQAWALFGFGTAYQLSGDPRFLDTARACADFFIERTPDHGIPPNDWEEPDPRSPVESSAAAIAGSGLLQLSELVEDEVLRRRYEGAAFRIGSTLITHAYLAINDPGWEGILKHGSYHEHNGLGVDESVMWGEYFFVELLDKLMGAPYCS